MLTQDPENLIAKWQSSCCDRKSLENGGYSATVITSKGEGIKKGSDVATDLNKANRRKQHDGRCDMLKMIFS